MDSRHPSERFLVGELRRGREGVQCERSLRTLSFLLGGWERYDRDPKPHEGKRSRRGPAHLRAIEFDKLGAFTFRLQNELFRCKGITAPKDHVKPPADDSKIVTYPSPFKEMPGKHGRGPARWDEIKGPIYLVDIIYKLQREGVLNYFDVTPPIDDPDNPNNHLTTVRSASPVTLSGFTDLEREVLTALQNSLRHLEPEQIRALGTHENFEKTLEDTKREFKYMARHVRRAIKSLESGTPFINDARELMEYADEAWRKSKKNHDSYKHARAIMLREINNATLQEAFENCQAYHEQIWGRPEMEELAHFSEKAQSFTKYFHAIAYYHSLQSTGAAVETREANKFTSDWEKVVDNLAICGLHGFPRGIDEIFVDTAKTIYPDVRDRLISQLRELTKGAS